MPTSASVVEPPPSTSMWNSGRMPRSPAIEVVRVESPEAQW